MKIIALEHDLPRATAGAFQQFAQEEARKAWDLHQAGLIRELFFEQTQPARSSSSNVHRSKKLPGSCLNCHSYAKD